MTQISVIVPVYNAKEYITTCIESICRQRYKDFEIVIVDDGSTDGSIEIAEKILTDNQLNFKKVGIQNEDGSFKNCGVSAARNLGIANAEGEWCVCIDCDDCINIDTLNFYAKAISVAHEYADFIFCDYADIYSNEVNIERRLNFSTMTYSADELLKLFYLRIIPIISPSILVNKRFAVENNIHYPEGYSFSEDVYYIWHLILNCRSAVRINSECYNYIHHKLSTTTGSSPKKIISGYKLFCEFDDELKESDGRWNTDLSLILPRWVVGQLHLSTKMLTYKEFLEVEKILNENGSYKTYKQLKPFRVKAAGLLLNTSPFLFYYLLRLV